MNPNRREFALTDSCTFSTSLQYRSLLHKPGTVLTQHTESRLCESLSNLRDYNVECKCFIQFVIVNRTFHHNIQVSKWISQVNCTSTEACNRLWAWRKNVPSGVTIMWMSQNDMLIWVVLGCETMNKINSQISPSKWNAIRLAFVDNIFCGDNWQSGILPQYLINVGCQMQVDRLIFNAISPTILLVITGPDSISLTAWSTPHWGYIFLILSPIAL